MIEACREKLVVEAIDSTQKKGLLYITGDPDYLTAKVIAVGERLKDTGIQPDMFVFTHKHAGYPIECGDKKYISINIDSVLAYTRQLI